MPFGATDGNVVGYSAGRSIAVSPINLLRYRTRLHELSHVVLGHTTEGEQHDGELTARNPRGDAEAVTMLYCAALDLAKAVALS
jgi:hypothetical protein